LAAHRWADVLGGKWDRPLSSHEERV